jgi:hypothetical protein
MVAAFNISAELKRRNARAGTLSDLAGWVLILSCRCRRVGIVDLTALALTRGGETTLGAVEERLRCQGCREPPSQIALQNDAIEPTRRLMLKGGSGRR